MLKPIVSQILQHLTRQNNWSRKHLSPFAGKTILLHVVPIKSALLVLEDGSLGVPADHAEPDATIHIPPSLAIRLLAKDEAAKMLIRIDGDSEFATEIGKVLQHMRWNMEEDLSQIIGDVAANKAVSFSKHTVSTFKGQSLNLIEMLTEYWQEEQPLLAKKWRVEQFNAEVDTLRSDVARFEKRLNKLLKSTKESISE